MAKMLMDPTGVEAACKQRRNFWESQDPDGPKLALLCLLKIPMTNVNNISSS